MRIRDERRDKTGCSMKYNSELTILLALKDRPSYTVRWMDYVNGIALPFKVLIADGGDDKSVCSVLSDKTRFSNVDYEYIKYPRDRTYADYFRKMSSALARVQTPYVVMADNDDFYIVDTLNEAVKFLAVNPDYVSCGGQGAHFWITDPLDGREDLLYSKNIEWKRTCRAKSIAADAAKDRIRDPSVSSSDVIYYDVKRTELARTQFDIVKTLNLNDLFLVESLIQFLTAVAGKTKRLDRLHIARQHNPPNSSAAIHQEKFGNWLGRMLVETWSTDFTKFVAAVSSSLAAADGISIDEAKDCVIQSYKMGIAPSLLSDILDEPTVTMPTAITAAIVRRLVRLPETSVTRRLTRRLYRTIQWISLDAVYGTEFLSTPVMNSRKDFQPILEFLTRPR
jgi:glycosyltransferase domain-containing protein